MRGLVVAIALLAACGDDSGDKPPPKPGQPAGAPAPGAGSGSGSKLQPQVHIEDRVTCPVKERDENDKKEIQCEPDKTTCPDQRYCLDAKKTDPKTDKFIIVGKFCKRCPERENIRHVFKERDFALDAGNRDPFKSFLIGNTDNGPGKGPDGKPAPTEHCKPDGWKIPDYSYADLKLVGIVSMGTQRRVLLMAGNKGEIITRGNCVGKERALVKEIGATYVTLQLVNDVKDNREPEEHSLELYPKALPLGALPTDDNGRTTISPSPAPVLPPTKSPDKAPPTKSSDKAPPAPPTKITPKQ
jgi:Tfp pilus assembly protein PilP